MTKTKGQASLEFLMTYGWAIIIIAVALLVLWQQGVFNPAGNMRPTYLGFWGVVPMDVVYKRTGDIEFTLQNNIMDGNVNITCINVTYLDQTYSSCPGGPMNPVIPLSAGNTTKRTLLQSESGFSTATQGTNYNLFMAIDYVDNRLDMNHTFRSSGSIQGAVETD